MSIELELRRSVEGAGLAVCVCGHRSRKQIVIPLSGELSARIEVLMRAEGIGTGLLLPAVDKP